jgi:hypothetical protein
MTSATGDLVVLINRELHGRFTERTARTGKSKVRSCLAQADSFRIVGVEESSSAMALCSQTERMMIFMVMASRWRGMSASFSSGSYVTSSQVVFTPASVMVMLSGAPCWAYCRVQERSISRAGALNALDEAIPVWVMLVSRGRLDSESSLMPNIFRVSRIAERETTK